MKESDGWVKVRVLYLTRLAEGFGFVTLLTLLPTCITTPDPGATTLPGVTASAGVVIGMSATGFTLVRTVAVVSLASTTRWDSVPPSLSSSLR